MNPASVLITGSNTVRNCDSREGDGSRGCDIENTVSSKIGVAETVYDDICVTLTGNGDANRQVLKRRDLLNNADTWVQAVTEWVSRRDVDIDPVAAVVARYNFFNCRPQSADTVTHLRFATAVTGGSVMVVTGAVYDE